MQETQEMWVQSLGWEDPLEEDMAAYSSILAWKIPWTKEPSRLQSMRSLGVGHDWATSLSLFTFMHWRRKWQPTPMFLLGGSQGGGSLVGFHLWGLNRVRHDWSDLAAAAAVCIRKWQPIPVFLPGKSHGQRNLADYSPSGRKRVRHDLAIKQQQESVYKLQD